MTLLRFLALRNALIFFVLTADAIILFNETRELCEPCILNSLYVT